MTSNTDDSIDSQTDCKRMFMISAINQLISDSNDLVFTKLLLIECIECHQKFDNLLDNYKHFLDIHKPFENINEINDNSVQKSAEKPKELTIKIKKNKKKIKTKGNNKETTERGPFVCQICDKSCTRSYGLKLHLATHSSDKTKSFVCGYEGCTRAYSVRQYMLVHRKIHLNPSVCHICDKIFSTKTSLKLHLVKHSEDKPYVCSWPGCDYRCKLKGPLDAHIKTHIGDKPYICDYEDCHQSYSSGVALRYHKLGQHLKTKNYTCSWPGCDSTFVNLNGLQQHTRRRHTGERPYVCDWPNCDKRFTGSDVLKRHKYTHTGERPYHCDIDGCTASFSSPATLGTHKKLVHKCNEIKRARWDNKKSKTT